MQKPAHAPKRAPTRAQKTRIKASDFPQISGRNNGQP